MYCNFAVQQCKVNAMQQNATPSLLFLREENYAEEGYKLLFYACNINVGNVNVREIVFLKNVHGEDVTEDMWVEQIEVKHNTNTKDIYGSKEFTAAVSDAVGFAVQFMHIDMQEITIANMLAVQ